MSAPRIYFNLNHGLELGVNLKQVGKLAFCDLHTLKCNFNINNYTI